MSVPVLVALPSRVRGDATIAARARVLGLVGEAEHVIVLAGGREPLVHDPCAVGRRGGADLDVNLDEELLTAVIDQGQVPRVPSGRLEGALGEMVAAVVAGTGSSCLPMTVPSGADAAALEVFAAVLRSAVGTVCGHVAVVAQGDLALHADGVSRRPPITDEDRAPDRASSARAFDVALVSAIGTGEAAPVLELGPARAAAHHADGWAALSILAILAQRTGRRLEVTARGETDGRGYLVAVTG